MEARTKQFTASFLQGLIQPLIDRRVEYQRLDGLSDERVKAIDIEITEIDSQFARHDQA